MMQAKRKILIAFILNLAFSLFEAVGGMLTGSIAILSDSVHDLGDAISIGVSYVLERRSLREADETYSFGYRRFSMLGAFVTLAVLVIGSVVVVVSSVRRLFHPVEMNYNGMILLAILGVAVNLAAAFVTRGGKSSNQRAVNLHMMEDVLGWVAVLIGSVVMRFTSWYFLDPLLSIGISLYILHEALETGSELLRVFLMRTPDGVELPELRKALLDVEGVSQVSGLRVFSLDGIDHCASVRITVNPASHSACKARIREILREKDITDVTIECDGEEEPEAPATGSE